ncbi:MAG TPA: hypothetical protein VHW23_27470 [Kofleriaceae bacterium]|jgi:hypothetical protein|nr:hypothetical protein [Kofleriaceae bacterium]
MPTLERRRCRSELITQALTYQLNACREDGRMHAMVLADDIGLPLASSGDPDACDEVAASMAMVAARTDQFAGTLYRDGRYWEVEMTRIPVDGSHLVVCAVGGSAEQRWRQVARGVRGARRILGAA